MHRGILFFVLLSLLSAGALAQSALTVGIDQATRANWDAIATRFQTTTGVKVLLQPYSRDDLAQQIVLQGAARTGRMNLVMVSQAWAQNVLTYLADLSSYESTLVSQGVQTVKLGGRSVGVSLSFAPGWFLAVLAWPADPQVAVSFLAAAGQGSETPSKASAPTSPEAAITTFRTTKVDRSQHNPKLDGSLDALLGAVQASLGTLAANLLSVLPASAQQALGSLAALYGVPFSSSTSTVTVVLLPLGGRTTSANVAALSALGVSQGAIETSASLIKVSVPLSQLSTIAAQIAGITFIRPPYIPYVLTVTGQGVAAIRADTFHAAGITGSGAKVAIIDLGFAGLSQARARGDLPATLQQNDLTGTGMETGISHGTAVAEIVYDVAPGAQLLLIKIADEVDLDQAVTYCLSNGVQIINHSLGWYSTNFYDGTGTIADIARRAISGGILWVNAAGNEADSHWMGTFTDSNSDQWNDQSLTLSATAGSQVAVYMTWNDWPRAASDYDLYLYGPASNLVASSTKNQTGTEEPTEAIFVAAPSAGTYTMRIKGSGSKRIAIYSLYQTLAPAVAASSILAPADVTEVVAVGAIDYARYASGPQEPYSSQGPTTDGRTKPDLCAPDNVSTGTSPYTTFAGTSGAAPHASGAAALLLSREPSLSGTSLRTRLLSQTVAMGNANVYGQGRLSLTPPAPANRPPTASFTYVPAVPVAGQTVTFNASGSMDPDGNIVSYAWSFGTGATGSGANLTYIYGSTGTYSVSLTVTDNGGATNATTQQVTVGAAPRPDLVIASFTHSPTSPTTGQPVTFTIVVRNQGGVPAGAFRVRLAGAVSSTQATVSQLAASASSTLTLSLVLSQASETFAATADDLGQVAESDESNNTAQDIVTAAAPQPVVARAGGPYAGTLGQPIAFNASGSSGPITNYLWTFGDGSSGQGVTTTHVYNAPGTYTATLTVVGSGGQQAADSAQVSVNPGAPPLSVDLSLPKGTYQVGESIVIGYTVNRDAYVYICNVDPTGAVVLVFPNYREPNPRASAGTHSVPGASYTMTVSGATGGETLYAFAAASPLPNFPTSFGSSFPILSYNGAAFRSAVRQTMQTQLPTGEWADDALSFTSVPAQQTTGTLKVRSSPTGASVTVDGNPSGTTPADVPAQPGPHSVALSLPGYQTETRQVTVTAGQVTSVAVPLTRLPTNQPPIATFVFSPASPAVGQAVTFDARASRDSDGTIVSFVWGFGDGTTGSGEAVTHTFSDGISYVVRLTVTDNSGAANTATRSVSVTSVLPSPLPAPLPVLPLPLPAPLPVLPLPLPAPLPVLPAPLPAPPVASEGAPSMDGTPGIFVWGTDAWHVTVNAGAGWTSPRSFMLQLRTDGSFQRATATEWTSSGVPSSAGTPRAIENVGSLLYVAGSLQSGSVDYTFTAANSSIVWMSLRLDIDGNGGLEESPSFVYLRSFMVHPPAAPLVVGLPRGATGPLVPSVNFRIGWASQYGSPISWITDIATLER